MIIYERYIIPKTINPIRKQILKQNRLQGISAIQSLRNSGYKETTARRSTANKSVKVVDDEILTEAHKRRIIDKAWKVLEDGLNNPKLKLRHSLAQTIASKDMTQKSEIDNKHPEKIIISYINKQPIDNKGDICMPKVKENTTNILPESVSQEPKL